MLNSQTSTLNWMVSGEIIEKLYSLWSEIAQLGGEETLSIAETDILSSSKTNFKDSHANLEWEGLRLLIVAQFSALLLVKSQNRGLSYQISLIFDTKTILNWLEPYREKLQKRTQVFEYLKTNRITRSNDVNRLQSLFVDRLLTILTIDRTNLVKDEYKSNYPSFSSYQLVPETLQFQIEQRRILDRVKIQISQNLDFLDIVKMTIEQVQKILEVDRLVIYQLDVPINSIEPNFSKNFSIDTVTYEARASQEIPSILYFQDEACFSQSDRCKEKYRQGFSLAIDDLEATANLPECLSLLMSRLNIRAKLVTPIIVQDKLWGFIIAHQCFAPRRWKNYETKFLQQIAEYLAIAIYQNESYQELQKQKAILEDQVKKRAQQLQDALLAAQAASQSKNEFIGNMSHEFRTPLTCVIGLSGTLLHWSLAQGNSTLSVEKQRQYLKTIQDSGKHLLELVNDIIDFSDVEAGKSLLNVSEFSIHNLARLVLQNIQEDADRKQINLQLDFTLVGEEDRFCADRDRVEQILINLLSNAIKFTSDGGQVKLKIWQQDRQIAFRVEDTGIGISKKNLPRLFEKFQQIEKSRQRTHGGTGLGLALTQQLVKLHGGSIEVESAVKKGSSFTVYLPNQNNLKAKIDKNSELETLRPSSCPGKTIILIAQDEEVSTLICEMLMAANYQVVWLIDDLTGIEQIALLEPALVIIDRECPEINVDSFCHNLKNFHKTKNIKIIVLSSQTNPNNWEYLIEYTIDDYLVKPVQPDYLLQKINLLCQ